MPKEKKALILSGISWDASLQRHHQVAWALKKLGYSVYFINNIPSSKFTLGKLSKKILYLKNSKSQKIKNPQQGIKVISLRLLWPGKFLIKYWNTYIIKRFTRLYPNEFDIIVAYLPVETTFTFLKVIKHNILIYDCVRNFSGWGGYPANIGYLEEKLVAESSFVLCDSFFLYEKLQKMVGIQKIHQVLPSLPVDIPCMPLKKIREIKSFAYIGTLGIHNDLQLLQNIMDAGYIVNVYGIVDTSVFNKRMCFNYRGYYSDIRFLQSLIYHENEAVIIPYTGNMNGVIPAKLPLALSLGMPVFINSFFDSNKLNSTMYVYTSIEDLMQKISGFSYTDFGNKYLKSLEFLQQTSELSFDKLFVKILSGNG